MSRTPRLRTRFQRAFMQWFLENRARLLVKLSWYRRTERTISLAFAGLDPREFYVAVRSGGITVVVEQDGEFFDALFDLDIKARRIVGGYVCEICEPDVRVIYETREDMWRDHLFEPFLAWVNEHYALARGIRLAKGDGVTWATLLTSLEQPLENDPELWLIRNLKPLNGATPLQREMQPSKVRVIPLQTSGHAPKVGRR